jgi:hypothetical protein
MHTFSSAIRRLVGAVVLVAGLSLVGPLIAATVDAQTDGVAILDTTKASAQPTAQARKILIHHPEFEQTWQVISKTRGPENKWAASVRWFTRRPVQSGDVLLAGNRSRPGTFPGSPALNG